MPRRLALLAQLFVLASASTASATSTQLSPTIFLGTASAPTVARGDHNHDARYAPRQVRMHVSGVTGTPAVGTAQHVELRLRALTVGVTGLCAAEVLYTLPAGPSPWNALDPGGAQARDPPAGPRPWEVEPADRPERVEHLAAEEGDDHARAASPQRLVAGATHCRTYSSNRVGRTPNSSYGAGRRSS